MNNYTHQLNEESCFLLFLFFLPSHVATACYYLIVVDESAAGQIARVAWQLAAHSHVALARLQAVYGTYVV